MRQFFIEGNEYSMMRLLSFLSVCAAIIISGFAVFLIFRKADITYIREAILLSGTLLGFGFGGKAAQKFGEKSIGRGDS
ncbi:MAG: hypothetical protein HY959_00485 [Ignavibacteriae bacterium]|nr:hypothetical protein [Ignavibacteriota bacterium]